MRTLTPAPTRRFALSLTLLATLFTLGPAGHSAAQADAGCVTAKTWIDPATAHAAYGDGSHDDWQNLQDMINYAIANHRAIKFEAGCYRVTKTLMIQMGGFGYQYFGFHMSGIVGPTPINYTPNNGVNIQMDAGSATQLAVLEIGQGAFYDGIIENIGLSSLVPNFGTKYGLLFAQQQFSHFSIRMMNVVSCNTCYAEVMPPPPLNYGGNGEAVNIDNCGGYGKVWYYNNNGQGFYHRITNSGGSGPNGSTAIQIGQPGLGFGLDVDSFSFTFGTGPLRNTLLQNDGTSGCVNVKGGRVEWCDTVLAYYGGSPNMTGHVKIEGMDLDFGPGNFPILDDTQYNGGTLYQTNEQYTNLFENDAFYSGGPLKLTSLGGDLSTNSFRDCTFNGFTNKLTDLTNVGGVNQLQQLGINIRDCRATGNPNTGYFTNMSYP